MHQFIFTVSYYFFVRFAMFRIFTNFYKSCRNASVRRCFKNLSSVDFCRIWMSSRRNFVVDPSRSFSAVCVCGALPHLPGFTKPLTIGPRKRNHRCRGFSHGSRACVSFPKRHDVTTHRANVIFLCTLQVKR